MGLDDSMRAVSARLERRIEEIIDSIVVRLREEVPDLRAAEQPEMWEAWRASTRATLQAALIALGGDREPPSAPPGEAVETARLAARAGIPLAVLLRTYRGGHAVIWEYWLDEVEAAAQPPAVRRSLLATASRFLFRYVDQQSTFITDEYTRERDRALRSREQERVQLVRDLLDGTPVDAGLLGYELDAEHISVIAWGRAPEAAIDRLAAASERRMLSVSVVPGTVWAWLGARTPLDSRAKRALDHAEPRDGTALAIGDPAWAAEGFRRTHRQARLAHGVALARPRPVTRYDDVALESFAIQDWQTARDFVARELGPLTGEGRQVERLRETLRTYFAASQNATAAAARLGVHERTVANRLRSVEERLGRPVNARRAELETALRLLPLLDSS